LVAVGHVELSGNRSRVLPASHQAAVRTRSQSKAQRVKKDGFAGTGFAGQDAETCFKLDVKPVDEDDVADGELSQHRAGTPATLA